MAYDYIYELDPRDPFIEQKSSIVKSLNETSAFIFQIRREKENLLFFLGGIFISSLIGLFVQMQKWWVVLILSNVLIIGIIFRVIDYNSEEAKYDKQFNEIAKYGKYIDNLSLNVKQTQFPNP